MVSQQSLLLWPVGSCHSGLLFPSGAQILAHVPVVTHFPSPRAIVPHVTRVQSFPCRRSHRRRSTPPRPAVLLPDLGHQAPARRPLRHNRRRSPNRLPSLFTRSTLKRTISASWPNLPSPAAASAVCPSRIRVILGMRKRFSL